MGIYSVGRGHARELAYRDCCVLNGWTSWPYRTYYSSCSERCRTRALLHYVYPFVFVCEGGYGYDSTDMAAIYYRLKKLKCDWIIGITDAGQVLALLFPPLSAYLVAKATVTFCWTAENILNHVVQTHSPLQY